MNQPFNLPGVSYRERETGTHPAVRRSCGAGKASLSFENAGGGGNADNLSFKPLGVVPLPSRELTYPPKMAFEDDFPFPKVGYVSSLEGICFCMHHPFFQSVVWTFYLSKRRNDEPFLRKMCIF